MRFFKGVAKALVDMGKGAGVEGYDAFKASVEDADVSKRAKQMQSFMQTQRKQ